MSVPRPIPTRVVARANIALVKYWGKSDAQRNLPAVGSLSLTLDGLTTETTIAAAAAGPQYSLDDRPMAASEAARIGDLLTRAGIVDRERLAFASVNRFPTAAGLASSASGGAAAVLAVATAFGLGWSRERLAAEALRVSGSAPRSLFGGFVRLDPDPAAAGVRLRPLAMPPAWDLRVLVLATASGPKDTSSRDAMARSAQSPYYPAWVETHAGDLDAAEAAIAAGDFGALIEVMEYNTLKMHALALATRPPVWYWNDTTLRVLAAIRQGRAAGLVGGYTMDAGPHVKLFCQADRLDAWRERLAAIPGVTQTIACRAGAEPSVEQEGIAVSW